MTPKSPNPSLWTFRYRLREWLDDIQISAQLGVPQYANRKELKDDIRRLLQAAEAVAVNESTDDDWEVVRASDLLNLRKFLGVAE